MFYGFCFYSLMDSRILVLSNSSFFHSHCFNFILNFSFPLPWSLSKTYFCLLRINLLFLHLAIVKKFLHWLTELQTLQLFTQFCQFFSTTYFQSVCQVHEDRSSVPPKTVFCFFYFCLLLLLFTFTAFPNEATILILKIREIQKTPPSL